MIAFLATISLFLFFGVVGYAISLVLVNGRDELHVLLAPTIGAAATILITMFANYFGAPVQAFGGPLAALLLLASAAVIVRRRAGLPRSLVPIGAALLAALVLTGRPFFEFGFDWVSYVNDDMNMYVSEARRIFEHGFLVAPDVRAFVQNRDATQTAYMHYVVTNARSGVENLLALVMAVLRLDGYRAFMPLMLALHLTLISAATALTYVKRGHARVSLAVCILLGVSGLTTLGTEYQLLGQLMGLPLFVACLVLACRPAAQAPRFERAGRVILCAIVFAAEGAVYPEIMTMLGVGVLSYFGVAIARKTVRFADAVAWLGGVAVCALALLNVHASTFFNMIYATLRFGAGAGLRGSAPSHFPYYLLPSGLPDLFGIIPLAGGPPEPWLSVSIVAGAGLFACVVVATVSLLKRGEVVGYGSFAVLFAALALVVNRNDFGLFKLAMYAQPLFIPALVMWWGNRSEPRAAPVRVAA